MPVAVSRDAVFTADGSLAAIPKSGRLVPLDREAQDRLDAVRSGASSLLPGDLELLSAGLLTLDLEDEDGGEVASREEVRQHLRERAALCVMPTEKCNLRCTYCYETFAKGRMRPELVRGLIAHLDAGLRGFRRFDLSWFGGEPLLALDIVDEVSLAFREFQTRDGVPGAVSMTTNGVLLTDDVIERLRGFAIDALQITVDGPLHDTQRVAPGMRGTCDRILENIERTLELTSAQVMLRVNFDSRDRDVVDRLADWLIEEVTVRYEPFGSRVAYQVQPIWRADTTSVAGICLESLEEFRNWVALKQRLAGRAGPYLLAELCQLVRTTGRLACYAGKPNHYVIGSDGAVYKCTVAFDLPENRVGCLQPNGELMIDEAREAVWVRTNALNDPTCGSCAFRRSCMGIHCPLMRIQDGRPPCPTPKKFVMELLSAGIREVAS